MNNKIEKNGILTFKYNMYDKNGNWITKGGPVTMIVGNDTVLPGLSNYLIGLNYKVKNQTIEFNYYENPNNSNFKLVDLDLEIYSYNDFENADFDETNDIQIDGNNSQTREFFGKNNSKNNKKEINDLKKQITNFEKNEILLNKKIIEISNNAQYKIEEFKTAFKNKHENKLQEVKDFQLQSFFEKILGPLNNLYMAVEFGTKNSNNPELVGYVKGFELLIDQIFSILDSFGITFIEPKIGDEFDPSLHNVIELVETDKYKKDRIIELKNRGYKLKDRVISPANVLVSK